MRRPVRTAPGLDHGTNLWLRLLVAPVATSVLLTSLIALVWVGGAPEAPVDSYASGSAHADAIIAQVIEDRGCLISDTGKVDGPVRALVRSGNAVYLTPMRRAVRIVASGRGSVVAVCPAP